jgi:hypothetical protein
MAAHLGSSGTKQKSLARADFSKQARIARAIRLFEIGGIGFVSRPRQ